MIIQNGVNDLLNFLSQEFEKKIYQRINELLY